MDELEGSSDVTGEKSSWSTLWKVKVPAKIRVFLWRLARKSIPTADVLHHRHMATQSSCVICGAPDSWRHSLLKCNMARRVWALALENITELIANVQEPHAGGWLAAVFIVPTPAQLFPTRSRSDREESRGGRTPAPPTHCAACPVLSCGFLHRPAI